MLPHERRKAMSSLATVAPPLPVSREAQNDSRERRLNVEQRAEYIFERERRVILKRTDRLFAQLMVGQWLFGILIAVVYSPCGWAGRTRAIHEHVYAAVFLGAAIASLPVLLALTRPGEAPTRHVIAVGQMLYSALLIHLTGGRIETHFHVFGSLAFLAFYRDWKVLLPATIVVAADHVVRQYLWPESVYGILNPEWWRFLEHAFWVVFEDIFLVLACLTATVDLRTTSKRQAKVESLSEIEREKSAQLDKALAEAVAAGRLAEDGSRRKSQFVADIIHGIRTPLNGVMGMTELLLRTELSAKQHGYVQTVKTSGGGLLAVINDILDLSKIEAGKMDFSQRDFDLVGVMSGVAQLMKSLGGAKRLDLLCTVAPEVTGTRGGDPHSLRQVLSNLVSNAVKFTEKGHVEMTVHVEQQAEHGLVLRFEVQDTGVGIAEDQQGRLFQTFSQCDTSDARRFGGTGLGLAISKRLVEMMGGRIGVVSRLGEGSTFWFTLPVSHASAPFGGTGSSRTFRHVNKASAPANDEAALAPDARLAAAPRVLVVDDNAVNPQRTSDLLPGLRYRV